MLKNDREAVCRLIETHYFLPIPIIIHYRRLNYHILILQMLEDTDGLFVCVEVLRPSQPIGVMSNSVSLPNHTFTGQA